MKTLKKLMALTLAFVMAMALAIPSFAVEYGRQGVDYDSPLRVTGLTDGDEAHFYQVIKWVGEASGNVNGWAFAAPFASDASFTPAVLAKIVSDGQIDSELAGKLARAVSGAGESVTASDHQAVLQNAQPGMWMALIAPSDANVVYNPVFISGDYQGVTSGAGFDYNVNSGGYYQDATAKKSELTLTKTASDGQSVDNNWVNTVAVGDEMTFTVNTTIPAYGSIYVTPKFELTDKLNGLKLKTDSVEVTDPSGLSKGTQYTVNASDGGYVLAFSTDYLKQNVTPTPVTVTYKATVTSDAEYAINQKDNEVTLKYSHNPNSANDYDVKKDTTQHYTFTLDASGIGQGQSVTQYGTKTSELVKTGVDAAGNPIIVKSCGSTISDGTIETWNNPLDGAVFGLYSDASCTKLVKQATTGSDGRMTFDGLDAGIYYLKEISAPAGFVLNTTTYTVTITAEVEPVTVTETIAGKEVSYVTEILKSYKVEITDPIANRTVTAADYVFDNKSETTSNDIQWTELECEEHPFFLENKKGTELPSTGGMGTKIFYGLGAVLVVGAGVVLVSRKRAYE